MRCLSYIALCLVLLGCDSHRAATEALVAAAPSAAKAPSGAGVESAPEPTSAAPASAAIAITDRSARGAERLVIREAQLRLRSANPRSVADGAARIAGAAGGFVLTSDLQGVDGKVREVTIDLRVPQAALDGTLRQLRALGTVMQETVTGQDVTEEFVDVSARLRAQTTLETRLLSLLEGSAQMRDMLTVEQELARVRGDIERMEGRLRYLKERSQLSSIHLVAQAPEQPLVGSVESFGSRLGNAVRQSFELSVSVVEFCIVAAGFVMPSLVMLVLAPGPFLWLRRRFFHRPPALGV